MMSDERFASCRGCGRSFTEKGASAQHPDAPRLCVDCYHHERAFHWQGHAPGVRCLDDIITRGTT